MGFLIGIANAFTVSFQNSFFKKLPEVDPSVLNWFRFIIGGAVMALLVSVFSEWKMPSEPLFWAILLGVSLPVELGNSYFYIKAFQHSPQSVVGPLFSLSVLFLLPLSYLVNGELPSFLGFLGVVLVMTGPFFLGWHRGEGGFGKALMNIRREPGAWRMLLAAFFAAIAVTFSKFQYRYVPPLVFAFYITAVLSVAISIVLIYKRISLRQASNASVFSISALYSIGMALHYLGLALLLAAYYISIKRLSIVFDVFFGRFMHHEDHFRARFVGALLMVAGVILIALG